MVNWTDVVIAGVGILFTAVIIPLVKAAFEWLKGKTQNEAIKAALEEAKTVADSVVASLQAGVVDGLKAKNADGKLTSEEIYSVAAEAIEMFKADISDRSLALIEANADNATVYIRNLIESRLAQLKKAA